MRMRDFLQAWGLTGLKINLGFLEGEFKPTNPDRAAAWDLYAELLLVLTTVCWMIPDTLSSFMATPT
jgi:hypothetical protein